jgi:cytochrome c-type protein NapB
VAILLTASVSGFHGPATNRVADQFDAPFHSYPWTPNGATRKTKAVPVAVPPGNKIGSRKAQRQLAQPRPDLVQPRVDLNAPGNIPIPSALAALARRTARFDSAPPGVPSITQDSSLACLACHGARLEVKDKFASQISHSLYASCTQCHVPGVGIGLAGVDAALLEPLAENQFALATKPLRGNRAWPQAPPTIPHGTRMRSDCLSCHGPRGLFALRTPHTSVRLRQCHAPSAGGPATSFRFGEPTSKAWKHPLTAPYRGMGSATVPSHWSTSRRLERNSGHFP